MNALRFTQLTLAGALIWAMVGCAESAVIAAAGVTAGFGLAQGQAEAFINGELKAARMVSMELAWDATFSALDELEVPIRTTRRDEDDSYIRGRAEIGPEIKIQLKEKSPLITKIEIRVGMMGDQAVSRLVLARIDHHLGIPHTVVPVEQSPIVAPHHPAPLIETRPE